MSFYDILLVPKVRLADLEKPQQSQAMPKRIRTEHCCTNCFSHPFIIERIMKQKLIHSCDFCGSKNIACIKVSKLSPLFKRLIKMFEAEEQTFDDEGSPDVLIGKCLSDHLQDFWKIFSSKLLKDGMASQLLDEIRLYSEGSIDKNGKKLYPCVLSEESWVMHAEFEYGHLLGSRWHNFVNHLQHNNRFVFNRRIAPDNLILKLAKKLTKVLPANHVFYRARRQTSNHIPRPHPASEMGAPPTMLATAGRAHPAGISVLYAAEEVKTAVAEIRPWQGAYVSVVECVAQYPVKILDLVDLHTFLNPFATTDLKNILKLRYFAKTLSQSFSKPLSDSDSVLDYLPTQYCAAVIQNLGFQGIRYGSGLCPGGTNIVIFDPSLVKIQSDVMVHRVFNITYTSYKVNTNWLRLMGQRQDNWDPYEL